MRGAAILLMVLVGCGGGDDSYDPGETTAAFCQDGLDNDEDGDTDCLDTDCQGFVFCEGVGDEDDDATCQDGLDNDLDGDTDCEDLDCEDFTFCEPLDCGDDTLCQQCEEEQKSRAEWCYQEALIEEEDPSRCSNISDYWGNDALTVEAYCYYEIAKNTHNCSLCEQIENTEVKAICEDDCQ